MRLRVRSRGERSQQDECDGQWAHGWTPARLVGLPGRQHFGAFTLRTPEEAVNKEEPGFPVRCRLLSFHAAIPNDQVMHPLRALLVGVSLACIVTALRPAAAQSGTDARAAARRHREANESRILREFSDLLALPNVAANRADIRRNADHLLAMLRQRGRPRRSLESRADPSPSTASSALPGATRTIVLYARSTDNPSTAARGRGRRGLHPPRQGALPGWPRDPLPRRGPAHEPRLARLRPVGQRRQKGSIIAMLTALDAMRAAGMTRPRSTSSSSSRERRRPGRRTSSHPSKYRDLLRADAALLRWTVHQSGRLQASSGCAGSSSRAHRLRPHPPAAQRSLRELGPEPRGAHRHPHRRPA